MADAQLQSSKTSGFKQLVGLDDLRYIGLNDNHIDVVLFKGNASQTSVATPKNNRRCAVTADRARLIVTSDVDVSIYSLPDLALKNTCVIESGCDLILLLGRHNKILFPMKRSMLCFSDDFAMVTELKDPRFSGISFIDSSADQSIFVTFNENKELVKWDSALLEQLDKITLDSQIKSLCIWNQRDSVIVTPKGKEVREYSLRDFKLIRSKPMKQCYTDESMKVRRASSEYSSSVAIISEDHLAIGVRSEYTKVDFPFWSNYLIKTSDEQVNSIILDKKEGNIVYSFDSCVNYYNFASLTLQSAKNKLILNPKNVTPFKFSCYVRPQALTSANELKATQTRQQIFVFRDKVLPHLAQFPKEMLESRAFLFQILKSFVKLSRANSAKFPPKSKNQILSGKFLLRWYPTIKRKAEAEAERQDEFQVEKPEEPPADRKDAEAQASNLRVASLVFFARKMRIRGEIEHEKDPFRNFVAKEVLIRNWRWVLDSEKAISEDEEIKGNATMSFQNGYIKVYIWEGEIVMNNQHRGVISFCGIAREIEGIISEEKVFAKIGLQFRLNFGMNVIEEIK